jgi:glycosyltransferase involved in cell wall biosynthesis
MIIRNFRATNNLRKLFSGRAKRKAQYFIWQFQNSRLRRYFSYYVSVVGLYLTRQSSHFLHPATVSTRFISASSPRSVRRKLQLGFHERGLSSLQQMANKPSLMARRESALWEIALWQIEQPDRKSHQAARNALELIEQLPHQSITQEFLSVLKTECYLKLGEWESARSNAFLAVSNQPKNVNVYAPDVDNIFLPYEDLAPIYLSWFNKAMAATKLESVKISDPKRPLSLDNIKVKISKAKFQYDGPLVSIIMPAYNAEHWISTAIHSLLNQTWHNIEIIVVDDVSTDGTIDLIDSIASQEERVKLVRSDRNGGPYAARNLGLQAANGEFITTHDCDDWSHPRKIECQVSHLINNPNFIANQSAHIRATTNLICSRRGNPGYYLCPNLSSFMFRREPVLRDLGFWDDVRFAGDAEFRKRILTYYGSRSVASLPTGPLSILRSHDDSLTAQGKTGYPGHKMGARREYDESFTSWHKSIKSGESPYLPFPHESRKFFAPHIMQHRLGNKPRFFDVVLMSDLRLDGGTTESNINEIKACTALGLRVALVRADTYLMRPTRVINPKIRKLIDGKQVQLLAYGEVAETDLLLIRLPYTLQDRNAYLPTVNAKHVRIILNQTPQRTRNSSENTLYDPEVCDRNARSIFGQVPIWHPIGPMAREGILETKANLQLADWDWVNLIDVNQWRCDRPEPTPGKKIIIGRHSRDHWVKWPDQPADLLNAYPAASDIQVRILGGASVPRSMLRFFLPRNWKVYGFGSMAPRDFLAQLDFFVYFTHPEYIEAFGRSIFEAMAVGVPVILPPQFQPVFGEAAQYAQTAEVESLIRTLYNSPSQYQKQVQLGQQFVEHHYGYDQQRQRLLLLVTSLHHQS